MSRFSLASLIYSLLVHLNAVEAKFLVCYYGSWATYRPGAGAFPVQKLDPNLCTHYIYSFVGLDSIKLLDPSNDSADNGGEGSTKKLTSLKQVNPALKTLVSTGGWNEGSIPYSNMTGDPSARATFVSSAVGFLQAYNFDGLDLDWEYPAARGGVPADEQNFVSLTRELSAAFKPHRYLLTAAVSAGKSTIESAYDIPQISQYLDLVNLMAYDYHGPQDLKSGINAPLFGASKYDTEADSATLNVDWSAKHWISQGAPREKLIPGTGAYGHSFTLDNATASHGINAPAQQPGQAGPYTGEPGVLGYNEICADIKSNLPEWTVAHPRDCC